MKTGMGIILELELSGILLYLMFWCFFNLSDGVEDEDDGNEEEEKLDKQLGDVDGEGADRLDEQMWGSDNEEEEETEEKVSALAPGYPTLTILLLYNTLSICCRLSHEKLSSQHQTKTCYKSYGWILRVHDKAKSSFFVTCMLWIISVKRIWNVCSVDKCFIPLC